MSVATPTMESKKPYIAVVSDMDGTFLDVDHTVSPYTRSVVDKLQNDCRIPFVFATGRHHVDVQETKRKIQLNGYVVTSNGARAFDPEGKVILKHNLDPSIARTLSCIALDQPDIATCIYQDDLWLADRDCKEITEIYQENIDVFYPRFFNPVHHESYEGTYKVYYTSNNYTVLEMLEQQIKDRFSDKVCVAYSLPNCMEVMAAGVNKGMALAKVLKGALFPNDPRSGEELLKGCISFGDGENDAQMLMMAGTGCLMGNAQTRLLEAVPYGKDPHLVKIDSNANNGVATKLKEVFQLE